MPGTALGRLSEPSNASRAAWVAAGAAVRTLHAAPLPPWPGPNLDQLAQRLATECEWLVANDVLPVAVIKHNQRIAETLDSYVGGSIQAVDVATGKVETLYTEVDGVPLKGPNDLVFDRTGGFWFTDHGKTWERSQDRGGLYYARPDGSSVTEVVFPLEGPNGVGLSPDESTVYVAETHTGRVRKWKIAEPGVLDAKFGKKTRGDLVVGLPGEQLLDSLAVDGAGHVCVATIRNGGISDIDPADGSVVHVPTGDALTTNICFGGPDLTTAYITCSLGGTLKVATWPRPGLKLNFNPY